MKRHGLRPIPSLLAGSLALLIAGQALAVTGERPRPEDFPDYARYIEASVDYQRNLEKAPAKTSSKGSDASQLCRDDDGGGDGTKKKKNSCEGKYLMVKDRLDEETPHDGTSRPAGAAEEAGEEAADGAIAGDGRESGAAGTGVESLEDHISRTTFSALGGGELASPTTTPTLPGEGAVPGLTLTEISADDLRNAGIDGLLGLFDNVRMTSLASGAGGGISTASSGATGGPMDVDGTLRATLEDMLISLETIDTGMLGNLLSFGDGYAVVEATVRASGNGLNLGLSAEVYTPVYIVDRDGTPGTVWRNAGAATIDRLAIIIPYLDVNIRSVSATSQDNSLLRLDAYSPQPIYVDLSNTGVGVASASADGSRIGTSTNFLQFGPNSMLTVAAGTRVSVGLARPASIDTAFVTLNGHVGDISIEDIRLIDNQAGGSLHIGRLGVRGIELIDASIFVDPNESRVIVDLGRGLSDVDVDIERLGLGNTASSIIGDFYVRDATVHELRFSATPH